jgi:hypothetical protein
MRAPESLKVVAGAFLNSNIEVGGKNELEEIN